jgi:hypothetical protein
MTINKPRNRRVIGRRIAGDHPVGNILATMTLDPPRGPHVGRKRVQDQRHHHRRLVRRAAMTISPIRATEPRHVHLVDRVDHKPRQMIGWQPIPDVGRQQHPCSSTAFNEVLRHTGIVLIRPAGWNPLYATSSAQCESGAPSAPEHAPRSMSARLAPREGATVCPRESASATAQTRARRR